jgi:signal transduction histidine kinase
MTTLYDQIDAVQAAVDRLRRGDVYALNEFPPLLGGLRQGVADLQRRQQELASLYEVGQELVSILDLDHLLELVLDRAIVLVGAERGFLVLWDAERQDFEVAVARQFARGEVDDGQMEISHGVIRRVLASREPVVTSDAQEDPRFFSSTSIITFQIRSVLAAPLIASEELIGAIYVDTRLGSKLFGESDLALLSALANQAAAALRLTRLYEHLQARNRELYEAMRELQETQEQLIQKEKLASVGQLAAGVAHEINNPLSSILLYADILCQEMPEENAQQRQDLAMILKEATRCRTIVNDLLSFSRQNEVLAQPTDLNALLQEIVREIGIQERFRGVRIQLDLDPALPTIEADPFQLRQVFSNLMNNAADAMPGGGTLTLRTKRGPWAGVITAEVQDTGEGISEENMKKLFTPFFTTKPMGKGTGLGLAIIYGIVKMHRGQIGVQSEMGQGTTFALTLHEQLPIQPENPEASAPAPSGD